LRGESDVARAIAKTRSLDWEPVVGSHVLARNGYLAGTDAERLADLNEFAADDSIDAIWCIRGGYGAMRLLDELDFDAWRRRPKTLIGYSDITALHAALGRHAELVTFHGPTAREPLTSFSAASLRAAVVDGINSCGTATDAVALHCGQARGVLAGGNLALLSSLAGTQYAPSLNGAILVLEDVNEPVYRIDRMLTQLHLSGMLNGVAGIALGQFTDIPDDPQAADRPLTTVWRELAERCGVPCLLGIPVGHINDQWTLPLGVSAVLNADERTLIVER
jgi:muramoyltetrapeptide carboxypeptidase